MAASLAQQLADAPAPAPGAPAPAPAHAATLTHLTLTSADLESMGLCSHCRYPCYLRCGARCRFTGLARDAVARAPRPGCPLCLRYGRCACGWGPRVPLHRMPVCFLH